MLPALQENGSLGRPTMPRSILVLISHCCGNIHVVISAMRRKPTLVTKILNLSAMELRKIIAAENSGQIYW